MQLELSLDGGVLQEAEANKLPRIHFFRLDFPDPKNYFGTGGTPSFDSPFEKRKLFSDQQGLFNDEPPFIKMAVSDFILAHKCPKVFNRYWLEKSLQRPPHHPVFDVGTKIDKMAKAYLNLPINNRRTNQQLLREKLEQEIRKLKLWHNDFKTRGYLEAFDDFCEYFENAKLSTEVAPNQWLELEFEDFRLGGRIDLLLQDWLGHKNLLIDLKLEKFGNGLHELQFPDIAQVLLYAHELHRRGIAITEVGYYYLQERALLVQTMTATDLQEFADVCRELTTGLKVTKEFMARSCELCLICPLQNNCHVGRKLTKNDFVNPLK